MPIAHDTADSVMEESNLHATCLQRTATALYESGAATESEIQAAAHHCYQALDRSENVELIEFVARAQGYDEARIGEAIRKLADRVADTMDIPPSRIPFASKLIVPNAFYDTYPEILQICKELLCPVIYAEDTDAIGVASINPVATTLIAEKIGEITHIRIAIRPFITTALMDYESWCFVTRKHFER